MNTCNITICKNSKCHFMPCNHTKYPIMICKNTKYLTPEHWFLCEDAKYLDQALAIGPKGVMLTRNTYKIYKKRIHCEYMTINNPWRVWAEFANLAYPDKPAFIAGVTGTNGKTTVAYTAYQLLNKLGVKAGYIGTNGVVPDVGVSMSLTTPDACDLHRILSEFVKLGISHVAMEVSSIGLECQRVSQIKLDVAIFTTFSLDHLDFHHTMENYWRAKMEILDILPDKENFFVSQEVGEILLINRGRAQYKPDYKVYNEKPPKVSLDNAGGSSITVGNSIKYHNPSFIKFMEDNLQAAGKICEVAGFSEEQITNAVANIEKDVPGRFEVISNIPKVIVDFAHTPDGLLKILQAFAGESPRVIVFGCGGDRDPSKRLLMGEVAANNAEMIIVTDDNPRSEDPESIRSQIIAGCIKTTGSRVSAINIGSRYDAIKLGIEKAFGYGYVCIIAGKGNETKQIYRDHVEEFSDAEVARKIITEIITEKLP